MIETVEAEASKDNDDRRKGREKQSTKGNKKKL